MNKAIASMIRDLILQTPVIDLFGGLVYTQTKVDRVFLNDEDEIGRDVIKKFPVTCDYVGGVPCDHNGLKAFTPDSNIRGMVYFEDNGVSPSGAKGNAAIYISRLRLIAWINTKYISNNQCIGITVPVMNEILEKLIGKNPINFGDFQKVTFSVESIPRVSDDLFNRYTYDEAQLQYLMPPYEYFGIDINTAFSINQNCVMRVNQITPESC